MPFPADFPAFFHCHLDDECGETESDSQDFRLRLDAMGIRYKSLHVGDDRAVFLSLSGTTITDLSPLAAFPLTHLCLQGCYWIADLSPLKGMSLIWLNLCRTRITDLSPLRCMPLRELFFFPGHIEKGLRSLRGIASLKKINRRPAEAFWRRYG